VLYPVCQLPSAQHRFHYGQAGLPPWSPPGWLGWVLLHLEPSGQFMSSTSQTRVAGSLLEFLVPSAFILVLTAQGANAASLNPTAVRLSESGAGSSIVQRTHGCHYSCECGAMKDFGCGQVYHRHLHMLCLPVRCRDKECDLLPPEGWCHMAPT